METRIKLNKSATEVIFYKLLAFNQPTLGGYAMLRNAKYYITTKDGKLVLKTVMDDVVKHSEITDLDTELKQFKIKNREFAYELFK